MSKQKTTHVDSLYDSKGCVKRKVRLHPDMVRPLYQYTSAEIRNWQREQIYYGQEPEYVDDSDMFLEDDTGIN